MLAAFILRYGYALVFVAAAIEGDATLVTAAFLAHRGYLRIDLVIVVAALATVGINQVYFRIGRRYGQERVAVMRDNRLSGRVIAWVERYGAPLAFCSRFLYGFRIAVPAACGATRMPLLVFSLADTAGAAVWAGLVGLAGFAIGHVLDGVVSDLRAHEWWLASGLFVAALGLLAWHGRDSWAMRLMTLTVRRLMGRRKP